MVRPGQVDSQFIVRDISKSHAGGSSFSYFIVQLIAVLEKSDCSIRVFRFEIPIMKFHAGALRSTR